MAGILYLFYYNKIEDKSPTVQEVEDLVILVIKI